MLHKLVDTFLETIIDFLKKNYLYIIKLITSSLPSRI